MVGHGAAASAAGAPHSRARNCGAACADVTRRGAATARRCLSAREDKAAVCQIARGADVWLFSDSRRGGRWLAFAPMKSLHRNHPDPIDETPPMPVADASMRAATHVAALPRDEIPALDGRHARGLLALAEITGATGESVVESLRDIAPDLADWIVDFSYGDVMSRPGLDRRTRQLATIAALTATSHAPQLKVHITGALNVGCTRQEIVEVILQMTVYAGFPAAINALNLAREVFTARGV